MEYSALQVGFGFLDQAERLPRYVNLTLERIVIEWLCARNCGERDAWNPEGKGDVIGAWHCARE